MDLLSRYVTPPHDNVIKYCYDNGSVFVYCCDNVSVFVCHSSLKCAVIILLSSISDGVVVLINVLR